MRQEADILESINAAVEQYESMELCFEELHVLSQVLRDLNANLFFLEAYRDAAKKKHDEIYFTCNQPSNAGRNKWADNQVPELYTYRRILESGYRMADGIRSQIGIYKKEAK